MTVPSKDFDTITDGQVDADSPLDTTLMTSVRDALINLRERIGTGLGTEAQNHAHTGTDGSALISEASIVTDSMFISRMEYYPRYNQALVANHGVVASSDDVMLLTINGTGTNTASLEEDASWIKMSTGATTNGGAALRNDSGVGWGTGATAITRIGFDNTWKLQIRTDDADITNTRIWTGFTDGSPNSFLDDTPDDNVIAFRYSTAEGDTNWMCAAIAGTGASGAYTDSGIAVAADTEYTLEVRTIAGEATYYINGTLVATTTTPLPSATTGLGWSAHIQTLANEVKDMYFRRLSFNHSAS